MSKLNYLTDAELLLRLDEVRHQSPVIGELCRRLEVEPELPVTASCECPVCQADLRANYNESNERLELKVNV